MKFAHTFQQALDQQGFPERWKSAAIQYKALKKCIKHVTEELDSFGLTPSVLQSLVENSGQELDTSHPVNLKYSLDGRHKSFLPLSPSFVLYLCKLLYSRAAYLYL